MRFPEGIIKSASGGYAYYYIKTDHLGSTRVLAYPEGTTMTAFHKTDYYPFGLPFKVIGTNYNRYLFSGKEIQDQTIGGKKLMLFDFGARNYDPTIARWFNIDPALQFTNPYIYCANNPINYFDPDGREVYALNDAAKQAILNTLPPEVKGYIVFNENGSIDRDAFNSRYCESGNMQILGHMVNDSQIFEVNVSDRFTYKDENGQLDERIMNPVEHWENYIDPFGANTGEVGFQATTQTPGNRKDKFNSPDDIIRITINSTLSKEGQAQNFAHEGYGHAYLFSIGEDHGHRYKNFQTGGLIETNKMLEDIITKSISETQDNMEREKLYMSFKFIDF